MAIVLVQGGAHLDAPADPSSADYPARPEWYFLSLYQMLKYFPGTREVIGTFVIPSALLTILFLLPLFDRLLPRRLAHLLACGFVFGVVGGAGYLTARALLDDSKNVQFHEARKKADAARERALELASLPDAGIPPDGAVYVLRRDPLTQGQRGAGASMPGLPRAGWQGDGRAIGAGPGELRDPRLDPRPAREPAIAQRTSARCPVATA